MPSLIRDATALMLILAVLLATSVVSVDTGDGVSVRVNADPEGVVSGALSELDKRYTLNDSRAERLVFTEVNAARRTTGGTRISWNPNLADAARGHARDMATQGYYGHVSPGGETPEMRYPACYDGENLLRWPETPTDAGTVAERTVEEWLNSPEHREIMLEPHQRAGVGVTVSEDGTLYVVMVFCD